MKLKNLKPMKNFTLIFSLAMTLIFSGNLKAQTDSVYIVLTNISDVDPYYPAVEAISNYRDAEIIQFDPADLSSLLSTLQSIEPRYAAIVMKPIDIHINFIREFMMMSTNVDADPFSDFSYGFITGATAGDALDFVNNIIYAEANNIEDFPLNVGGYAASSVNVVYTSCYNYMDNLDPVDVDNIYLETSDLSTGINYFLDNAYRLENKKILDIGHNGDPHMLWLFEGGNMDPDPPVWDYDPAKIEDPAYGRVGLKSHHIGAMNLYPAVAFNGACHAGEPKTVMVEGDIAATFGETNGYTKFYTMSDTFSFALNILKTGITGYFAPCGANNANDQGEEVYNAFLYDEPLGDIHKRTNDGVVMGFLGNRPDLKIFVEDEWGYGCDVNPSGSFDPDEYSGACYMLGGKANRIYFGDPLFDPYKQNHSPLLELTTANLTPVSPTSMEIQLLFNKPDNYYPVWDKFHFGNTRIYKSIELPSNVGEILDFQVIANSGPYDLAFYAVELFEGKYYLHIEVDIPDDMYAAINYDITFLINHVSTGIKPLADETNNFNLNVYPNPSNGNAVVSYDLFDKADVSLKLFDVTGREINTLFSGAKNKGQHKAGLWMAGKLPEGIYYIVLDADGERSTQKISVIK
ncbi:MAG: hypothetical protein A2W91_05795 [Bacteroidetes bacterium GWF2_38_335]|nr:MAG: hypothetical protein A2W91_05795 [Bacteroidetes bacterium GWF2_38_335]OFY81590.1 MAG: hypothetical protein A2281_11590 [Bacteroidetes bacterium RIFOXYA12_FULL_38_20]HBS88938.1 hypothetical protein [Bacteroidales bacterium]